MSDNVSKRIVIYRPFIVGEYWNDELEAAARLDRSQNQQSR